LFLKLRDAGLVKTAQIKSGPHGETLRNSIVVLNVQVAKFFHSIQWLHRIFSAPALILGIVLAGIGFWASFSSAAGKVKSSWTHGHLGIVGYALLFVGVLTIALLHESFHGLAALHYGLEPRKITVALYLGFIPYVYISIPGIYTIIPKQRIVLWSAGLYANVLLAAGFMLLHPHLVAGSAMDQLISQLAIANLSIVIFNLSPFMSTDIYFILSTLLKAPNVRTRSYSEFLKWFKNERNAFRGTLAVYSILSFMMIGYFGIGLLRWIWVISRDIIQRGVTPDILGSSWPVIFILLSFIAQQVWNRWSRSENASLATEERSQATE